MYPASELSRTDHHLWAFIQTTFGASITPPVLSTKCRGWTYYKFLATALAETGEESLISNEISCDFNVGAFTLSWTAPTGAVEYRIYIKQAASTVYGLWNTTKNTSGLYLPF